MGTPLFLRAKPGKGVWPSKKQKRWLPRSQTLPIRADGEHLARCVLSSGDQGGWGQHEEDVVYNELLAMDIFYFPSLSDHLLALH